MVEKTIGLRIKEIRKIKSITQFELGTMLNVSRDKIANLELDRVAPDDMFIDYLCNKFGINEKWLRTGEGVMFLETRGDLIDRMMRENSSLNDDDRAFIEFFIQLAPEKRKLTVDFAKMIVNEIQKSHGE